MSVVYITIYTSGDNLINYFVIPRSELRHVNFNSSANCINVFLSGLPGRYEIYASGGQLEDMQKIFQDLINHDIDIDVSWVYKPGRETQWTRAESRPKSVYD